MVGKCYNFLSLLILESLVGLRQIRPCPRKPGFQWPFGNNIMRERVKLVGVVSPESHLALNQSHVARNF